MSLRWRQSSTELLSLSAKDLSYFVCLLLLFVLNNDFPFDIFV